MVEVLKTDLIKKDETILKEKEEMGNLIYTTEEELYLKNITKRIIEAKELREGSFRV